MANRYIPTVLRDLVAKRAGFRCEYCRSYEKYSFFAYHVEHIISIKHGGKTEENNLAYACPLCNRNKGSDIATFVGTPPELVRFYHPSHDQWGAHFSVISSGVIEPTSMIGTGTVKILELNHPDAILERNFLIFNGLF